MSTQPTIRTNRRVLPALALLAAAVAPGIAFAQAPEPPKPPQTSFHILPLAVPNGAGIGLSWETP